MPKYKIMDLFAGVGGLSYGFSKLPEFEIIAANEISKSTFFMIDYCIILVISWLLEPYVMYIESNIKHNISLSYHIILV